MNRLCLVLLATVTSTSLPRYPRTAEPIEFEIGPPIPSDFFGIFVREGDDCGPTAIPVSEIFRCESTGSCSAMTYVSGLLRICFCFRPTCETISDFTDPLGVLYVSESIPFREEAPVGAPGIKILTRSAITAVASIGEWVISGDVAGNVFAYKNGIELWSGTHLSKPITIFAALDCGSDSLLVSVAESLMLWIFDESAPELLTPALGFQSPFDITAVSFHETASGISLIIGTSAGKVSIFDSVSTGSSSTGCPKSSGFSLADPPSRVLTVGCWVTGIARVSETRFAASCADGGLFIWGMDGRLFAESGRMAGYVGVAFTDQGKLVTLDSLGRMRLHSVPSLEIEADWFAGIGMFSVRGNTAAVRSEQGVFLFDLTSNDEDIWENVSLGSLAVRAPKFSWKIKRRGTLWNKGMRVAIQKNSSLLFAGCSGDCAKSDGAPLLEADFELPFEFDGIRGSFDIQSDGPDCLSDASNSSIAFWDADQRLHWEFFGAGFVPNGCTILESDEHADTLDTCRASCVRNSKCNAVQATTRTDLSVTSCQLIRCDSENLEIVEISGLQFWKLTRLPAGFRPTGFVSFGSEKAVVFGRCLSTTSAQINAVTVEPSRSLRFQVSQTDSNLLTLRNFQISVRKSGKAASDIFNSPLADSTDGFPEMKNSNRIGPNGAASGNNNPAICITAHGKVVAAAASGIPGVGALGIFTKTRFSLSHNLGSANKTFRVSVNGLDSTEPFWDEITGNFSPRPADHQLSILSSDSCGIPGSDTSEFSVSAAISLMNGSYAFDVLSPNVGIFTACACSGNCNSPAGFFKAGSIALPGPSTRNYFTCIWADAAGCALTGLSGLGLKEGDKIAVLRSGGCGGGNIEDLFPNDGIMTGRQGGTYFRTEQLIGSVYLSLPVEHSLLYGANLEICWCRENCVTSADFRVFGGKLAFTRFIVQDTPYKCEIGDQCTMNFLPLSAPLAPGDKLALKSAAPGCTGDVVSVSLPCEGDCLLFDFGIISIAGSEYNVCWCQGSSRACSLDEEYDVDVGQTLIASVPRYLFPSKCGDGFIGWRAPWLSYADCCCNFKEAGALPGCEEPGAVRDTCSDPSNMAT